MNELPVIACSPGLCSLCICMRSFAAPGFARESLGAGINRRPSATPSPGEAGGYKGIRFRRDCSCISFFARESLRIRAEPASVETTPGQSPGLQGSLADQPRQVNFARPRFQLPLTGDITRSKNSSESFNRPS
jgi:hypothetical protein